MIGVGLAEVIDSTHESVSLRLTTMEVVGLSNVINHVLHGGFCIDADDCGGITGLEWEELQELWRVIRESRGLDKGIN